MAETSVPGAPVLPSFGSKGSKKVKTYVWASDSKGNLVKVEASTAKKSFATLDEKQQTALAQYLISTNILPTTNALKSLWDKVIDGAVAEYKTGKQSTAWDVLGVLTANTPVQTGIISTQVREYDPVTANAYLNNIALTIGYDTTQLSDTDRADFASKIQSEAAASGKVTTKKVVSGGTETVVTPDVFDPKTFAENWLWSKVNLGDTTKLPASAVTSLASVNKILRGNGIDYLAPMEVNKLAVDLAAGKKSLASIQSDYHAQAIKNYPQLADRLTANPGSTVMDLASTAVSSIAKWLELDPDTIDLNNQYLDKYLRPDGPSGKQPIGSLADLVTTLKNSPEAEKTSWANDAAQNAATSLARAMGFGV